MRWLLFIAAGCIQLAAQGFSVGTANDGCTGGSTWTAPVLRFGPSFSCAFPVAQPGTYTVKLTFVDPSVSVIGGRIFSVSVNGWAAPSLQKLDLIAAGATMLAPFDITVPALSVDGYIRLQITTIVRSAVLSSVTITPSAGPPGPSLTGQACEAPAGTGPTPMVRLPDGTCLPVITISPIVANTPLAKLAGPVIPWGTEPWTYYSQAERGNVIDVAGTALAFKPHEGPAAAGTFTLTDGCTVTLTGAAASEFTGEDFALVKWDAADGPGTGRMFFQIKSISGNVITSLTMCGLPPNMTGATGLTVYHCGAGCSSASGTPTTYDLGWWTYGNGGGWNFYDPAKGVYDYARRTAVAADMTKAYDYIDTWWTWGLNSGNNINPVRNASLLSQFIRALDGKPARFPAIYKLLKNWHDFLVPHITGRGPYFDSREDGYMVANVAYGAIADPDPTRHAWYCNTLHDYVPELVSLQKPEGYWSDKSTVYPYRLPGTAAWRQFAIHHGLGLGYDAISNPADTVCYDAGMAAKAMAAQVKAGDFLWDYGRSAGRGVYYDVMYPNAGQSYTTGTGTVSVSLSSTSVVGVGTHFTDELAVGQYIGIQHSDGIAWTYAVTKIADAQHLSIGSPFSDGGDNQGPSTDAVNEPFLITAAAPTNCFGAAPTCWSGQGSDANGKLLGGRDFDLDLPWVYGWLYKTTRLAKWRDRGDEFVSAAFGGPAGGPGTSGPCAGPGCDGQVSTSYINGVHGCTSDPTLPCNPDSNHTLPVWYNNATTAYGKAYGQGSGIGSMANYLAWRLLPANAVQGSLLDKQQCVGGSCAGIELWTLNTASGQRVVAAIPATPEMQALPKCPAASTCWQAMPQ